MTRTATPTAEDRSAVADGSMTVNQAAAFSGLSRSELFVLMRDGPLDWFHYGEKRTRLITRRSLVEYLASVRAANRK